MRTRRSPQNQDRLWKYLTPKPSPATTPASRTPLDLDQAFWLSPRAKKMIAKDRAKAKELAR